MPVPTPKRPRMGPAPVPKLRLRWTLWLASAVSGGLLLVLAFFAVVGVVNFAAAPGLWIVVPILAIVWLLGLWAGRRGERAGQVPWRDRERRGF